MHNEYNSVVRSTKVKNHKQSVVNVMGLGVSSASGYQSDRAYSLNHSPGSTTDSYRRWANDKVSDSDDNSDQEQFNSRKNNVNSMPNSNDISDYTTKNLQDLFKDILEATDTLKYLPTSELESLSVTDFIVLYKESLIKAEKDLKKLFNGQSPNSQIEIKRQLRLIGLLKKACETDDFNTLRLISQHLLAFRTKTFDGGSFLCQAAGLGSVWLCERLLEMGIEVDDRGLEGVFTPLQRASYSGHEEVAKLLLKKNAYVNTRSLDGKDNTALHLAASKGHEEVVRLLLAYGAYTEETNDMEHTALMEAATAGHVEVAACLIENGATVLNTTMEFKETAFTIAALKGQLPMVKFLLSNVSHPEEKVEEMHTALMGAAMGGHINVAEYLLQVGAKVSLKVEDFETPLTLAAGAGHVEFAKLMLDNGSCIEEKNDHGYTSLMEAAKENHLEMVEFLVSRGANVNAETKDGEDAFMLACKHGNTAIVHYLELHCEFDKESKTGHTPLMWAAKKGHFFIVQYLVDLGADVNKATHNNDMTVLSAACSSGNINTVYFLLMNHADPLFKLKDGTTMLIEATKGGHADMIKLLFGWLSKNSQLPLTSDDHIANNTEYEEDDDEDDDDDDDDDDIDEADQIQPFQLNTVQPQHPTIDSIPADKDGHCKPSNHGNHELSSIIFSDNSDNDDYDDEDDEDDENDDVTDGVVNKELTKSTKSKETSYATGQQTLVWKAEQIEKDPELQKLLRLHVSKSKVFKEACKKTRRLSCGSDSVLPSSKCSKNNATSSNFDKEKTSKALKNSKDIHYCTDKACCMCGCMKAVKRVDGDKKSRKKHESSCQGCTFDKPCKFAHYKLQRLHHQHSNDAPVCNQVHHKETCSYSSEAPSTPSKHLTAKQPSSEYPLDIDALTVGDQETALTLASSLGYADFVYLFLSKGSNIEHKDRKGFTPLLHAASAGHLKIVKILLRVGANIEVEAEKSKDTALSLACANGHAKIVELLIHKGADTEHRNIEDYTPLSHAAAKGHVKVIEILLLYGAEINSRTNSKFGMSPLMLAAMYGHANAVTLLLDRGCDVNAQNEIHRTTALSLACFNGKHEIVSILVDRKANLEHRAKAGITPLMEAAQGGFVEVGKILLDRGADVGAVPVSSSRDTALGIAAEKGHLQFVELLLSRNAPIDVKNKRGATPLWLACNSGHLEVVKLLLQHGSDPDSMDNRKISCLVASLKSGQIKIVKLLVEHVSQLPPDPECVKYRKAIYETEKPELIEKCLQCLEIIKKAKEAQAMKAYENAVILLDELQQEKKMEAKKRAAREKKREKKKQRKKDKTANTSTNKNNSETVEILNSKSSEINVSQLSDEEHLHKNFDVSDEDIFEKENKPKNNAKSINAKYDKSTKKTKSNNLNTPSKGPKDTASNDPSNSTKKKTSGTDAISTNPSILNNLPLQNSKIQYENCMDIIEKDYTSKSKISSISDLDDFGYLSMPPTNIIVAPVIISTANSSKAVKLESKTKSNAESVPHIVTSSDQRTNNSISVTHSGFQSSNLTDSPKCLLSSPSLTKVTTSFRSPNSTTSSSVKPFSRKKILTTTTPTSSTSVTTYYSSLYKKDDSLNNKDQLKKVKKIDVPAKAVSRVIGRGGCNINAIREFSGAKIDLDKLKTSDDAVVTIKGVGDSIVKASELITALIREADKDIEQLIKAFKNQLATGSTSFYSDSISSTSFWKRNESTDALTQKPISTPSSQNNVKDFPIPTKNVWENRKLQNTLAERNKAFIGNNSASTSNETSSITTTTTVTNAWLNTPKISTSNETSSITTTTTVTNAWLNTPKISTSISDEPYSQQVIISNLDMSGSNVWDNSMADGIGGHSSSSAVVSSNEKPQLITTFPIGAWKSVEKNSRITPSNNYSFQKPLDQIKAEKNINDWVKSVNSSNNISQQSSVTSTVSVTNFTVPSCSTYIDSNKIPIFASKKVSNQDEALSINEASSSHADSSVLSASRTHSLFNFADGSENLIEDTGPKTIREYSPFGAVAFNNQPTLVSGSVTTSSDMVVDKSKAPGYRPTYMIPKTPPISQDVAPTHYNHDDKELNAPKVSNLDNEVKSELNHGSLFSFSPQAQGLKQKAVIENEAHYKGSLNSNMSLLVAKSDLIHPQPQPLASQHSSNYPFNLEMFISSQQKNLKNDAVNDLKMNQQLLQHNLHYPPNQQRYQKTGAPILNSDINSNFNQMPSLNPSTSTNQLKHYSPLSSSDTKKQSVLQPIGTERNSKKQQKPPVITTSNLHQTMKQNSPSPGVQSNHLLYNNFTSNSSNSVVNDTHLNTPFIKMNSQQNYPFSEPWSRPINNTGVQNTVPNPNYQHISMANNDGNSPFLFNNVDDKSNMANNIGHLNSNIINRCHNYSQMMSAGDTYDAMSHNSIMHPRAMHYQQQLHHYQPTYPHAYNNDTDNWYLKQAQRDKNSWNVWTLPENK